MWFQSLYFVKDFHKITLNCATSTHQECKHWVLWVSVIFMNIWVFYFLICLVLSVPTSRSPFRWLLLTIIRSKWKIMNYYISFKSPLCHPSVSSFQNRRILIIASTKTLESITVAARHLRLQKYEEKRESNRELSLVLSRLSSVLLFKLPNI